MKRLFLTSSIGTPGVGASIRSRLGHNKPLTTVFITTPIEVEDMTDDQWYQDDRKALTDNGFEIFDYTITGKGEDDIKRDLGNCECIYISGGNNNYLLGKSQECNFAPFVRDYVNKGNLYIGTSAGSIVTGPLLPPYLWGEEKGYFNLADYSCYNIVNFTVIPHWGSKWFQEKYLNGRTEQIYDKQAQPFVLINDYEYVEVIDDNYRIIDVRNEK